MKWHNHILPKSKSGKLKICENIQKSLFKKTIAPSILSTKFEHVSELVGIPLNQAFLETTLEPERALKIRKVVVFGKVLVLPPFGNDNPNAP